MLKKQTLKKNTIIHLITLAILAITACKKEANKKEEPAIKTSKYSYEVNCNNCDITYINADNQSKTIRNHSGSFTYTINTKVTFVLQLTIKTLITTTQTIQAYILKDDEVVYGNLGYNTAAIIYNTQLGSGSGNFGIYVPTSTGGGGSNGGGTISPKPAPTSSVCGAKNKTGGYCKRVVIGGGRCWQH